MSNTSILPSNSFKRAGKIWVGKTVRVYIWSLSNKRMGPYTGIVKGIADNAVAMEDEGKNEYDPTGLLVKINELGPDPTFGERLVRFNDAEII